MISVLVSNVMMAKEKARFQRLLTDRGFDPHFPEVDQFMRESELVDMAGRFDAFLSGDDEVTARVLDAHSSRLKIISKWGTGLDSYDLLRARELGIPVKNSPGAFSDAVAEVAVGYMLDLSRNISRTDRRVRAGDWPKYSGEGLKDRVLGLVGFGAIGREICNRALAMKMSVLAFDPGVDTGAHSASGQLVEFVGLRELLSLSDIVCLACSANEKNIGLVNADVLSSMKTSAILINVSRGSLVVEADLTNALKNGVIAGAGLDVYEVEPVNEISELLKFENVVLGSHNANNLRSVVEYVHENSIGHLTDYFYGLSGNA